MARLYTSPPKFSELPSAIRVDIPVYRLRDDIFTDDTLFPKGSTIEADEDYVPNIAMFPVNEAALKQYRAMLAEYDAKGEVYNALPLSERRGYMQHLPKLPAFEKEWKKVNQIAKTSRMHICQAIDTAPSVLGAPRASAPKVRSVDMNMVPHITGHDDGVIQGNKTVIKAGSVTVVQASV